MRILYTGVAALPLTLRLFVLAKPAAADKLTFLATGDWGGQDTVPYYEDGEMRSAAGMAAVAADLSPRFFLGLGDNFYSDGISTDVHDARFNQTFEAVFTGAALQIPFYPTAGNHDWRGNMSAQLAYSTVSARWTYPHFHHRVKEAFTGDDGQAYEVEVLLIDTVLLCGRSLDDPHAPAPGVQRDDLAFTTEARRDDAMAWLGAALEASTADYLWVAGHYPIWSACSHGPTAELVAEVLPLLEAHRVTGYLSGHDHCSMHIADGPDDASGGYVLQHVLSGNGDDCCYPPTHLGSVPAGSLKFLLAGHGEYNPSREVAGFTSFVVQDRASGMRVHFHGANGTVLYTTPVIPPRERSALLSERGF